MWTCPKCGVALVARNLSHSCGAFSVATFLDGKDAATRALFDGFVALIAACGPYTLAPAKTRVAFVAQVRFASVNRASGGTLDIHFVLPRALRSTRFRRVEQLGKLFVHHVRIASAAELDAELAGWLRMSYAEYGERRWIATPAKAAPAKAAPEKAAPRATVKPAKRDGAKATRATVKPAKRDGAKATARGKRGARP